jgi:phage N-6-adenine-methyltransferase
MARRMCARCESVWDPEAGTRCKCRCAQCNKQFTQSRTKPRDYCSRACQNKAFRKRAAAKNTAAVTQSLTNEWYTPVEYVEAARRVMGDFDLDPASCEEANQIVQAARYFSEADDGMAHEWKGRVWLNPPYGRLAGQFVLRCAEQYTAGNVAAAVILVNAHCTDTAWFRPLWDGALCFTYGRLNFAAGTAARGGSTHGSVFAYLGPDPAAFAAEFGRFGAVVTRYP